MNESEAYWGPDGNRGRHRADGFHPHPRRALKAWREGIAALFTWLAGPLRRKDASQ